MRAYRTNRASNTLRTRGTCWACGSLDVARISPRIRIGRPDVEISIDKIGVPWISIWVRILQCREIRVGTENAYPCAIGTVGTISPWNTLWSRRTRSACGTYWTGITLLTLRTGSSIRASNTLRTYSAVSTRSTCGTN